ncbi:MAG: sulfur transferase domain-containing protein [Stagnimonas sp.]|nr:sulfur transferase domain-containing protein [Stagnimonas sp.]
MSTMLKLPQLPPPAPRLTGWRRLRVWLNSVFVDHAFFRVFYNLRTPVAPGLYRSAHPLPYQLRAAARAGVKSVLNFRGNEDSLGSNVLEWEACEQAGLQLLHFPLRSRDAPTREEVLGLDALYASLPRPLLIHCKSGADRAGLASALYLLLRENAPLDVALKQMQFWRHGHVKQAKTGVLDHFFEVYRAYHAAHGTPFRAWVETVYDRDAVNASFHASWWANQLVDKILRRE